VLFVFGVFSVLLSAMQVALAVQPTIQVDQSWIVFAEVCRGFSVATLCFVLLIALSLILTFVFRGLRETIFALRHLYRKHRLKYGCRD